jgi:lipopolysaccharide heptosyltransferase II
MPSTVIVRLPNWLGDTVMAVPALSALRAGFPEDRIVLAGPWAHLMGGQGLAEVLVAYPRTWPGRLRTADTVRELHPELALLLPNSLEAALAAWYWGARRRIGFAGGGRDWLLTDRVPVPAPRPHQVDEYLMLTERLGLSTLTRAPCLKAPEPGSEARETARTLLRDAGVDGAGRRPRVAVHLGAAFGPSKLWPVPRLAELCRLLGHRGGTPVLLGTLGDAEIAEAITAQAPAASIVGRDAPGLLPAVLSEFDAVVCGDTGVGHLAAALGVPVVTLFGPTDPVLTAPRGSVAVVTHPTPCAPCFYRTCPIDHPCLRSITADEVGARLEELVRCRA